MIGLLPRLLVGVLIAGSQLGAPVFSASDLLGAALENNQQGVIGFLQANADVNERGPMGASPLHWAAFHGNEEMVGLLLDAGARLDATLDNGSTPLHLAAYKGHLKVARLLWERGADTSAETVDGVTPIAWARHKGHAQLAELLSAPSPGGEAGTVQTKPVPELAEPVFAQPLPPERQVEPVMEPGPTPKPTPEPRPKPKPQPEPETKIALPPQNAAPESRARMFRVQLVAMSSEAGARREMEQFHDRFGSILQDVQLVYEAMKGGAMYRVLSGPLPEPRARALCEQLKQHQQSCLLRRVRQP